MTTGVKLHVIVIYGFGLIKSKVILQKEKGSRLFYAPFPNRVLARAVHNKSKIMCNMHSVVFLASFQRAGHGAQVCCLLQ